MLNISMIRKNQHGFTLIELLVTIVIFGIFVIGIVNLYITTDRTQRQTYHLEVASRAGEAKIESLRNSQYNSLSNDTDINFKDELPDELPEPKDAVVHISEPEPGLKRVDIVIEYGNGKDRGTVKQSSLIGIVGIGN